MEPGNQDDDVITRGDEIVGCRGRVLLAVLVLAVLILILTATLFYRLFTWTPPVPRRAAADPRPATQALASAHPSVALADLLAPTSAIRAS